MCLNIRSWTVWALILAAPLGASAAEGIRAATKPSRDLALGFVRPGRVETVLVKEGDTINPGDVLVQQDAAAEKVKLMQLRMTAENEDAIRIEAAEKDRAQKEVDLKERKTALEGGGATVLEVQHAELEVEIKKLSEQLAKLTRKLNWLRYDEMKIMVDRMSLVSPIAGKVEQILVREGEAVEAGQKAVRVVELDPLWVEPLVPLEQTRDLKVGAPARVEFLDGGKPPLIGKIVFIAAVAQLESRVVRVEIANKPLELAGESVLVHFLRQHPPKTETQPPLEAPTTRPAGEVRDNPSGMSGTPYPKNE